MRVFLYFVRAYPRQSLAVLLCLLLAGVAEGVGLSTLLPLLLFLTEGEEAAANASGYEATVLAILRDGLARVGLEPTMGAMLTVVVCALLIKGAVLMLSKRQLGYTVAHIATDLRLGLLSALLATRWRYFTRQPLGTAANAMATEAERASYAYHYVALIAGYTVEASVYLGIAMAISWQATVAAASAGLMTVLMLSTLVRMAGRAGRKQTMLLKSLLGRLTDTLHAVKLLKATGREGSIGHLLEHETQRLNRQMQRRVLAREALKALQEPILLSLILVGVFVAHQFFDYGFASISVLALISARTLSRINSMQSKYQSMVAESSALWSLLEMTGNAEQERERSGGTEAPHLSHAITLRDVHISYKGQAVLDGFDMEIPVGHITAVIGRSGAGKTTMADLITGLVQPDSGDVAIDGVPLSEIDLGSWRRRIGYVPQEMLLLHDTVRVNVTLGEPGIPDAEVERALRDAGAYEFVSELPDGMNSTVGERGALLSGGQRQRLAIARALVNRPDLLILDEATAALDAASEADVWRTVASLRGKTTVLAISHQRGLLHVADRVYRLGEGRAERVETTGTGNALEVA